MEGQRFLVKGRTYLWSDPALQDALANLYDTPERPRCLCAPGGIEMYIAKHRDYVIKRMPDTGHNHHPTCPAYEAEPGTSGLGELLGESVIEHSPESVELRVDFPFARVPGRALPRGDPVPVAEVHASWHRMSLLAVMHFLYERAGLNRWYPAMEGQRNQGVLCKYLLEVAEQVKVKGDRLSDRLYVPEPFSANAKAEIAERRRRKLAILQAPQDKGQFKMALVIGEFKDAEALGFGHRLWIKHLPDAPLFIDNKAWEKAERAYGSLLQARDVDAERKPRVLLAALVYAKREQTYQVDTLSMMLTTARYVPIEGVHELALVERLCDERRSFLKPLRYDASSAAMFPNVLLLDALDAHGKPSALHVVSSFADPKERAVKEQVLNALGEGAWAWYTDREMPEFPRPARYAKRMDPQAPPAIAAAGPVQPSGGVEEPTGRLRMDGPTIDQEAHRERSHPLTSTGTGQARASAAAEP